MNIISQFYKFLEKSFTKYLKELLLKKVNGS